MDRGRGRGRGRGGRSGRGGKGKGMSPATQRPIDKSHSKDKDKSENGTKNSSTSLDPELGDERGLEELCLICAEPIKLFAVPQCNHRTCHICAVRLRALYKKKECTFCKATSDTLILSSNPEKDFMSFSGEDIPYKDDRLSIYFETQQARDETLILLHFNCPEESCDYAGSSWKDLKSHASAEHGRFFCDLCIRHSHIFVHEQTLYTSQELSKHIQQAHKHCDFCKLNFYSDDELYVHMRDRHEQCFLCKRHEELRDEYHRDYNALERHFRKQHYLCEAKECLEKKFVVFDSEMDFKAHQVAEHGSDLTSREKREALKFAGNFHFEQTGSQHRSDNEHRSQARARNDSRRSESTANRDPLGVSSLASRSHVPGSGGSADHRSRRAMFGNNLSGSTTPTSSTPHATPGAERVQRHQAYMARVAEIVQHSEAKMHSFRSNVRTYHAGEMSSGDLVDAIQSIITDQGQMNTVMNGLVDLLEEEDQKQDVLASWTASRIEQTHFPSLGGTNVNEAIPTLTRGQVRNVKNQATASSRNVWANVERAAASGSGYRGMKPGPRSTANPSSANNFPSLGSASRNSNIPGSAAHSFRATAAARASVTPWAGTSSPAVRSTPSIRPFSVEASSDAGRLNQTSVQSNSSAFPSLPKNVDAVRLAEQKRMLFEHKRKPGSSQNASGRGTPSGPSGTSTPTGAWTFSDVGRIDTDSPDTLDADMLANRLDDAASIEGASTPKGKKGNKQKKVLVTLGGLPRG